MKILIATDSFKESLSAPEVGQCIEKGFQSIMPEADYCQMPLADGGEGTVDVLLHTLGGEVRTSIVDNPIGQSIEAHWALLDQGQTALIEIASASGIDKLSPNDRNPYHTSTFGTGQLILEALETGVHTIIIALGGSATNDAGAGILQALGGKLLDKNGNEIVRGGGALADIASIDLSELHPRCSQVQVQLACDVDNPLIGKQGASYTFAPQKGANFEMVRLLDHALAHFADVVCDSTGIAYHQTSGFGAAGGAALGLALAFNVQIKPGIDLVLEAVNANLVLNDVDLVITGEGKMDKQTLHGKVPFGIAKLAKAKNIPVIAISGSLGQEIDALYDVIDAAFDTVRAPLTLEEAMSEARQSIIRTSRNIAMLLKLGNHTFSKK